MCRQDNAVRFGVILALEHAMVKAASLGLKCFDGIKHGYFNVIIADDNPEVTGLFLVEVRLFRLGFCYLFLSPALLLRLVPFVQPTVMGSFKVLRADILDVVDVLSALLQKTEQTVTAKTAMLLQF